MSINKQYQININIARNLDVLYKRESTQKATLNFKKLLNNFKRNQTFLFVLNSLDQLDITGWIDIALEHKHNVYCLVRKKINEYYFLKMDKSLNKLEIFKNTLQPKYDEKIINDESLMFDYIVFPMTVFDKEKYFVDNELNMNLLLLLSYSQSLKIGYAYSFQSWDMKLKNNSNSIKTDFIVTENYFF